MKILVISSYLPYPLFSGGHVRLYNILQLLSKKHEITLIAEKRPYQKESDISAVKKVCKKVIVVPRVKQWSVRTVLKTGFSSYPFLLAGHLNKDMKRAIAEELENDYDLIHVETFYVMHNIPLDKKNLPPVILVEHNIEYLVYERYAQHANFLLKPLLLIDIAKLKRWEERFWEKADRLVAVSEEEKQVMRRDDVAIIHNGIDSQTYSFQVPSSRYKEKKKILFIGNFDWIQNSNAAEFIVTQIWPKILIDQRSKDLELWIVGKNIPQSVRTQLPQVIYDEHAPDETVKIYNESFALLAPIRVGGGTSYKVLEAMASGLPVITTKLGIEGINGKDNEHVLLAETADEFVEKIFKLTEEKELYATVAKNGSDLIRQNYDWRKIVEELEKVYRSVA